MKTTPEEVTAVRTPSAIALLEQARAMLAQTLQILDEVAALVKPLSARVERLERLTADQGADIAQLKTELAELKSQRVA